MKTPPILFALIAIVATHLMTHSASARIGETRDECIVRYGQPNKYIYGGVPGEVFQKEGFMIVIEFIDGRAARMTFRRGNMGALSDEEVATFLRANGKTWELAKGGGVNTFWVTHDRLVAAVRSAEDGSLFITTKAANAAAADKRAKSLAGF